MSLHNLDLLFDEDLPEYGHVRKEVNIGALSEHVGNRQVVHFDAVRQESHSNPLVAVITCHDHYFVPSVNEALRYVPHVHFNTTDIRVEEVGNEGDSKPIHRHFR